MRDLKVYYCTVNGELLFASFSPFSLALFPDLYLSLTVFILFLYFHGFVHMCGGHNHAQNMYHHGQQSYRDKL